MATRVRRQSLQANRRAAETLTRRAIGFPSSAAARRVPHGVEGSVTTLVKEPLESLTDERSEGIRMGRGGLRRCTLCLEWVSVDDIIKVGLGIEWCACCAARHPEVVPPAPGFGWPFAGWLVGAFVGCALADLQGIAGVSLAAAAAEGSVVGASVGLVLWLIRRHSRMRKEEGHE